jgi:WD40 repeat protein
MISHTHSAIGIALTLLASSHAAAQELTLRRVLGAQPADTKPKTQFAALSMSHDGKVLASAAVVIARRSYAGSAEYRTWDTQSGKLLASWKTASVEALALSPDGNMVAGLGGGALVLWSARDGRELHSHEIAATRATVAFSPDCKKLGVAVDDAVVIRNAVTGVVLTTRKIRRGWSAVFSPDLGVLATECHQDADLLRTATGKLDRTLPDHRGAVSGLAFSSDGRRLAVIVATDDIEGHFGSEIVVWNLATGTRSTVKEVGYFLAPAFFVGDGHLAVMATKDFDQSYTLKVMEIASGKAPSSIGPFRHDSVSRMIVSGDGRVIAVGCSDGSVRVYDLK